MSRVRSPISTHLLPLSTLKSSTKSDDMPILHHSLPGIIGHSPCETLSMWHARSHNQHPDQSRMRNRYTPSSQPLVKAIAEEVS